MRLGQRSSKPALGGLGANDGPLHAGRGTGMKARGQSELLSRAHVRTVHQFRPDGRIRALEGRAVADAIADFLEGIGGLQSVSVGAQEQLPLFVRVVIQDEKRMEEVFADLDCRGDSLGQENAAATQSIR